MKMDRRLLICLGVLTLFSAGLARADGPPAARKDPVTDTYFGTTLTDDYRWLEDMKSTEVTDWLKGQADYTKATLDKIPGRDALVADFVALDAKRPALISGVVRKNGRYFYKKTLPTENVGRLYYREGLNGKETLLFDPTEGANGKSVSLTFYEPTEDGKKVALGVAEQGSESATIRILNVDDKTFAPETIAPCWQGVGGWSEDGTGFTYNLMNSTDVHDKNRELNTKEYFHVVGTDPKDDIVVLSAEKYASLGITPQDIPIVVFSDDHKWIVGIAASVRNELTMFVAPATELKSASIPWKPFLKPEDQVTNVVAHGDMVYLLSHKDAPKYKILSTSITNPDVAHAALVLPEGAETIDGIDRTKDYLLVTTTDGINNHVSQYSYASQKWEPLKLPRTGTVGLNGYDITSNDAQMVITSWTKPTERYQYSPQTKSVTLSPLNVAASYPGMDDLVVDEVLATAKDGTKVPLSIIYNKRVAKNGKANCYLSGYGAYGISATPHFSILNLGLMNRGVIVAVAHVRGGGEKGFDWYHAGYKATKPNTWNDFIACGEYLVQNKYTSPAKLFGEGTSAGGILIGRAITERPDLFGAAICNVPCANAVRMENSPNGPINTPEFGTVQDANEFKGLLEMDAFQHVKQGTKYPAVICVGGFNDPRVIVWQPAKFAAALQNATGSGKPVLLQVNYDDGHFTEDKKVTFRNFANMYAFCLWQTGHPDFQVPGSTSASVAP
ncbi:MAG TPA: prolyl oligopeptidase family serine peptidase [Candidatus Eisenbacteria bacterium]|nr:prolyl oligopeptidase family serine peptidase [Candidatus Eisenbacteria bacterium]